MSTTLISAIQTGRFCEPWPEIASPPGPPYRATRRLLMATLLAAPLAFGAVQIWAWTSLCVLASLLLLLWALEAFNHRVIAVAWSPLYFCALGLMLLGVIQLICRHSLNPRGAKDAMAQLAADSIVFFIALQVSARPQTAFTLRRSLTRPREGTAEPRVSVRRDPQPWRTLGLIITIYTFLLALYAILQFFSAHGLIYWRVKTDGWVFGPYVNHNHYAGLMDMLIPVSVGYVLSRRKHQAAHVLLAFMALVPVSSVLLSGSRGGCLALLGEFLVLGVVVMGRCPAQERRRYAALGFLGILVVGALFFWLSSGAIRKRLATLGGLARSPEVTLGERLAVSRDTLRMFRDHLWLGTGLGSFGAVYPQYQSFATDTVYHHAHDDYVEALAGTGVTGALLIVLALIFFFRGAFSGLRSTLRAEAGWIRFGAALGCCGVLIHSFADFNLHIPANAMWFAFLLGISQAAL